MIKNKIEITTESTRAFNSMISKSNFLENNLKVLIDTLTKTIDELSSNIDANVDSAETNNFVMEKIESMTKGISFTNENVSLENSTEIEADKLIVKQNVQVENNPKVDNVDNSNLLNKEVINIVNINENESQTINNQDNANNQINNQGIAFNEEELTLPNIEISEETDIKNKEEQIKTQDFEFLVDAPEEKQPELVQKNVQVTLTKENIKVSEEVTQGEKEIPIEENINKDPNLVKLENEEQINIKLLLNDPKAKREKLIDLRDNVISIFREVKGTKELPEEISLKRIFKSFKDVINELEINKELFSKDDSENITKEVTRMRENLELISDLNKYNTVVHIPIQMNSIKSVAELYVFNGDKENSKRKINENNATMFLSLGTANMGQVESYIKVVNKTVECKFMTEKKVGSEFINENKEHLVELLAAYGYTLIKASAETYNGESLNIFEAIEKNKQDDMSKGFDAKA